MEVVERKRCRRGFLNLFDWPGKSRKKLFSSDGLDSEESKQTKQNAQNRPNSGQSLTEVDESGNSSSYNAKSDSSGCASSVSSDEGQGTRAPNVVARLMGLESLPVPNLQEPRFNPDCDPFFLRPSRNTNKWNAYENLGYVNLRCDYDGIPWEHLDSRTNDRRNRPIDQFQSETFPPRSVKPICVTNNRLLSPIRSPGFVPSSNHICVMEVASRMIESSPRIVARTRFAPDDSPSSVPMRIRNLREKLEAAQKVSRRQISNDILNLKYPNGKHNEKRTSTSLTTPSTSKFMGKNSYNGLKGKVKPSYVSAQAKASTTPLSVNRNESQTEAKKRVAKVQNGLRGLSIATGKSMLKQSNQKQNCRDNQPSVTSVSNQKNSKVYNKAVNKVAVESGSMSKQSGLTTALAEKKSSLSLPRKKTLPRSKQLPNGMQDSAISDNKRIKRSKNLIKCNITIDGGLNAGIDDRKKEMDVISFTFSSPIKGLSSELLSSTQGIDQDTDSAVSFNMFGGDSLNVLLEKKLRELTSKLESSSCSLTQEESSGSIPKDAVNGMNSSSSEYEKSAQNGLEKVLSESESVSDCTSFYDKQKFQMIKEEEYEVSSISTVTEADDLRSSCIKDFSNCSQTAEYGIIQSDQEFTWVASNELQQAQDEFERSESVITLTYSEAEERRDWELEYISDIIGSDQLLVKEFALEMATDILPESLFDEMEGRAEATTAKIKRKALFDFVNNCLAVKCEQLFMGTCRGLMGKGGFLFEQRDWLAEELNREIHGLKKMRDMMMDELVYKDMSSAEGRWLDFKRETYEEGIDVEGEIVSTLIGDLVNDLVLVFKEDHES